MQTRALLGVWPSGQIGTVKYYKYIGLILVQSYFLIVSVNEISISFHYYGGILRRISSVCVIGST